MEKLNWLAKFVMCPWTKAVVILIAVGLVAYYLYLAHV